MVIYGQVCIFMPNASGTDNYFFFNSYALVLLQWMKSQGIASSKVLENTGLSLDELQNVEQRIPESKFFELLQNARGHFGEEAFGLQFGAKITLVSHGVLGQALISSQNIGHAVEVLLKYQALLFSQAFIELKQDENEVHVDLIFSEQDKSENIDVLRHEVIFSCMVTSLRQMLAAQSFPVILHVSHNAPTWKQAYHDLFGPEVYFGADINRLTIDKSVLTLPLLFANHAMAEIFEQQCEILLAQQTKEKPYSQKVGKVLLARPGYWPNIDETAQALFTSTRSLRRHLSAEKTSFQTLLDDIRCNLAKEYLKQNQHSVSEIAMVLGYSDLSNFRRAYQRWTGETPKRKNSLAS